jgi:hypothetical protein
VLVARCKAAAAAHGIIKRSITSPVLVGKQAKCKLRKWLIGKGGALSSGGNALVNCAARTRHNGRTCHALAMPTEAGVASSAQMPQLCCPYRMVLVPLGDADVKCWVVAHVAHAEMRSQLRSGVVGQSGRGIR